MAYNSQHYTTFIALLQLWGLPPELAQPISNQLANIDNTQQDELIKTLTVALHKKQSP
jgi:hypothetical protein